MLFTTGSVFRFRMHQFIKSANPANKSMPTNAPPSTPGRYAGSDWNAPCGAAVSVGSAVLVMVGEPVKEGEGEGVPEEEKVDEVVGENVGVDVNVGVVLVLMVAVSVTVAVGDGVSVNDMVGVCDGDS